MRYNFAADLSGQSAIQGVLGYPPDAGAGSGVGSTVGQSSGGTAYDTGGGTAGSQGRTAGSQQGGATPYQLTDDSLILHEGKPVKWSDHRAAHFVNKADHDRLNQTFTGSRDLLTNYAKKLDEGYAALEQERQKLRGQGQQQQPQQQRDIVEDLAGMPLLDGQTAARAIKTLRDQGLAPIAQLVAQQASAIQEMRAEMKGLKGTASTLAESHQSAQFEDQITTALKNVGEIKGLSTPVPTDNPVIRAIASDLWLSYDAKTWKMPEYYKMLNERIAGLVGLVLEDQKKAIGLAKEKKRQFFDPKAGKTQPSGQGGGFKFMNGMQLARESGLFDKAANA